MEWARNTGPSKDCEAKQRKETAMESGKTRIIKKKLGEKEMVGLVLYLLLVFWGDF